MLLPGVILVGSPGHEQRSFLGEAAPLDLSISGAVCGSPLNGPPPVLNSLNGQTPFGSILPQTSMIRFCPSLDNTDPQEWDKTLRKLIVGFKLTTEITENAYFIKVSAEDQ